MRQTMTNLIREDLRSSLSAISTPTDLIWGQNDQITPLYLGQELSQLLPHSTLHVIAGARHTPHSTHLQDFLAVLRSSLESSTHGKV
jgi:pimeloyl-ACP methyl ester carboxylesterase